MVTLAWILHLWKTFLLYGAYKSLIYPATDSNESTENNYAVDHYKPTNRYIPSVTERAGSQYFK